MIGGVWIIDVVQPPGARLEPYQSSMRINIAFFRRPNTLIQRNCNRSHRFTFLPVNFPPGSEL